MKVALESDIIRVERYEKGDFPFILQETDALYFVDTDRILFSNKAPMWEGPAQLEAKSGDWLLLYPDRRLGAVSGISFISNLQILARKERVANNIFEAVRRDRIAELSDLPAEMQNQRKVRVIDPESQGGSK